jgi:hypothetical protein
VVFFSVVVEGSRWSVALEEEMLEERNVGVCTRLTGSGVLFWCAVLGNLVTWLNT